MLRWLMSWCVPERALALRTNFEQSLSDREPVMGQSLFSALASYTRGDESEPATPRLA